MAKIGFFELAGWEKAYLEDGVRKHHLMFYDEPLDLGNVNSVADCDAIGIFIYSKIDGKILDKLPKLKLIVTMSTGFDHIDLEECKRRGITVCNVPTYADETVAEHTFAIILAIARKMCESVERTRKGDFSLEGLMCFDLEGKTLGVIGVGGIGSNVIRIAKGFLMDVLAFDVRKNEKLAKELGFSYVTFDELLQKSDIITLHCPYNKKTHHLINKDNLKKIKKGAILINTARGGVVETEALLKGLKEGIFAGIGLDVLEEEHAIKEERQLLSRILTSEYDFKKMLAGHMLLNQENVVVTPHNAFNSKESLRRILDTTISNMRSFYAGKPENTL
jgi:D-lactate dehydrogenase